VSAVLSIAAQHLMCHRKHRYAARIEALIEAAKHAKGPQPMRAYRCPCCRGWHITKKTTYSGSSRPEVSSPAARDDVN